MLLFHNIHIRSETFNYPPVVLHWHPNDFERHLLQRLANIFPISKRSVSIQACLVCLLLLCLWAACCRIPTLCDKCLKLSETSGIKRALREESGPECPSHWVHGHINHHSHTPLPHSLSLPLSSVVFTGSSGSYWPSWPVSRIFSPQLAWLWLFLVHDKEFGCHQALLNTATTQLINRQNCLFQYQDQMSATYYLFISVCISPAF